MDCFWLPDLTGESATVGSGFKSMGRELASDKVEFHEMENDDFSDLELISHVRDALISVQLVSFLKHALLPLVLFIMLVS